MWWNPFQTPPLLRMSKVDRNQGTIIEGGFSLSVPRSGLAGKVVPSNSGDFSSEGAGFLWRLTVWTVVLTIALLVWLSWLVLSSFSALFHRADFWKGLILLFQLRIPC